MIRKLLCLSLFFISSVVFAVEIPLCGYKGTCYYPFNQKIDIPVENRSDYNLFFTINDKIILELNNHEKGIFSYQILKKVCPQNIVPTKGGSYSGEACKIKIWHQGDNIKDPHTIAIKKDSIDIFMYKDGDLKFLDGGDTNNKKIAFFPIKELPVFIIVNNAFKYD
jgi:hypothetical protein